MLALIRKALQQGYPVRLIAATYGVSERLVEQIKALMFPPKED